MNKLIIKESNFAVYLAFTISQLSASSLQSSIDSKILSHNHNRINLLAMIRNNDKPEKTEDVIPSKRRRKYAFDEKEQESNQKITASMAMNRLVEHYLQCVKKEMAQKTLIEKLLD